MTRPIIAAMLLAIALPVGGAGADGPAKAPSAAEGKADAKGDRKGKGDAEGDGKGKAAKDPKQAASGDEKPACMRCGATCGLEAVCVCEPGTKKRPKTEFEVECNPICIAGCGNPFGQRAGCTGGCTTCGPEACECRGRIRVVKKLERKNVDEEVPTVVRKVKYLCECCAGKCGAGCCGPAARHRAPSWWSRLLPW
jgi:hypothetical protein